MLGTQISKYFENPTDDKVMQTNYLNSFQSGGFTNFSSSTNSSDWKTMFGTEAPTVPQYNNSNLQTPNLDRFSSMNFNTFDLPGNDQLFPNANRTPTYPSETVASDEAKVEEGSSSVVSSAETAVEGASSTIPSLAVGVAASTLMDSFTNSNNSDLKIQAEQGNGPNGHAFDAVQHADQQNNLNNQFSSFRTAAITTGSAFGPEGLAVGLGVAAASSLVQHFDTSLSTPNENTTMSTGGNLVNAAVTN